MKRIVWISWLCLLGACGTADELRFEEHFDPGNAETVDIAYLKSLCRGASCSIRRTLIVEGRITGNDLFREFPRRLWIEDRSGGIELLVDGYRLHERYPVGAPLRLFCEGLWLGDYGGRIQLGAKPEDERTVGRIDPEEFSFRSRLLAEDFEPIVPRTCTIGELTPALVGRFIRISEVRFVDEEAGLRWCDTDPETGRPVATRRRLCDDKGRTLTSTPQRNVSTRRSPCRTARAPCAEFWIGSTASCSSASQTATSISGSANGAGPPRVCLSTDGY